MVPVIFTGYVWRHCRTSTNVFTISCLSIEPPPPVNLVLQHWCKALQSLYWTIRRLFVLFLAYSRTIRTIRRLFADYSYYSSTIRGLFVLFVDYSYYSSTIRTIRTIRFTILVLSIAETLELIRYRYEIWYDYEIFPLNICYYRLSIVLSFAYHIFIAAYSKTRTGLDL